MRHHSLHTPGRIPALLILILSLFGAASMLAADAPVEAPAPVEANAAAFELPVNQWTKVAEVPADLLGRELEPGRGAYMAFVPDTNLFIRYGGYTPTESNALWTFDLAKRQWANPVSDDYSFPPPADRPGAGPWWSMAWDAKRKVVWMHGGFGVGRHTHGALFADVWQYRPATGAFKKMDCKKYPAGGQAIVYDPKSDLLIRSPGPDSSWAVIHNRDATWVYNIEKNEWEKRLTKGSPKARLATVWMYDPPSGKCVYLLPLKDGSSETWTYDATANAWEKLELNPAPPGRTCTASAYDAHNKVVLVYGGVGQPAKGYGYLHRGGGVQLNDTWSLDVTKKQWTKLDVGAPVIPTLGITDRRGRFELCQAAAYDQKLNAFVVAAPTMGVWALRYQAKSAEAPPAAKLAALPALPEPKAPDGPVYKMPEPNPKLLKLEPGKWLTLTGRGMGGGEVPATYDEATGFVLKYGGCNDGGTTFASGYGNDLWAYCPATERWLALRYTDPCGPPRPNNGCTRYYAYDPDAKGTWFAGGTSGNYLGSSKPPGWKGHGIWKYDGLLDRFVMVATSNGAGVGAGVVTGFDRDRKLFITGPKSYSKAVYGYSPLKQAWSNIAPATYSKQYTFATYVESKKFMLLVSKGKDGGGTFALDTGGGGWRNLEPAGALPDYMADGRPVTAYDPDHDAVLLVGGQDKKTKRAQEAWVYRVQENRWEKLPEPSPNVDERMVYDRRHKVFLGFGRGKTPVAFRLAH